MSGPGDRFAALQSRGDRDYQEDEFGILDGRDSASSLAEHTLLVVADGMGGHVAGARASQILTESFIDTYQKSEGAISERLQQSLNQSNADVAEAISNDHDLAGMGSTLLATVISEAGLEWISVGDSPLWLYREGELKRINQDHSMAPVLADMVAAGKLSESEAASDPKRNALRSAVMGDNLGLVDSSSNAVGLQQGDVLLLASDGVMTLSDVQIASLIEDNISAANDEILATIMQAVMESEKPNQDNTTILIYSVDPKSLEQANDASTQLIEKQV